MVFKAIIHRAIRLMHTTFFQAHQCFKHNRRAQNAPVKAPGRAQCHQPLQSTRQYVMDKVMAEFPKFLWVFQP